MLANWWRFFESQADITPLAPESRHGQLWGEEAAPGGSAGSWGAGPPLRKAAGIPRHPGTAALRMNKGEEHPTPAFLSHKLSQLDASPLPLRGERPQPFTVNLPVWSSEEPGCVRYSSALTVQKTAP